MFYKLNFHIMLDRSINVMSLTQVNLLVFQLLLSFFSCSHFIAPLLLVSSLLLFLLIVSFYPFLSLTISNLTFLSSCLFFSYSPLYNNNNITYFCLPPRNPKSIYTRVALHCFSFPSWSLDFLFLFPFHSSYVPSSFHFLLLCLMSSLHSVFSNLCFLLQPSTEWIHLVSPCAFVLWWMS